jgi:putative transposase/ribonuclease toxin BrnT of type II toxin-antitoxin system
LRYLGRYTRRIAIGNERIVAHEKGEVTFSYKDREHGGARKTKTLPGTEFTRRFLLHVVPRGFVRVRHFGLLANGVKIHRLALARTLLGAPVPPDKRESWQDSYRRLVGKDPLLCPASATERRDIIVGHSVQGRLLVVSFTDRGSKIRLISARPVTRHERHDYEEAK